MSMVMWVGPLGGRDTAINLPDKHLVPPYGRLGMYTPRLSFSGPNKS